ncbi:MAG: protein-disulfide reductase DsbD domain-containing protein, partial [Bacteroidota bacterium]
MIHRLAPFLFLLLLGLSASLNAQIVNPITWRTYHEPAKDLKVGDEVTVYFEGTIEMGYHIYSAVPAEELPQLASFLDIADANRGVEALGELQEKGEAETKYDAIFELNITIYKNEVIFSQKFKITEENPKLSVYIGYQVCNE